MVWLLFGAKTILDQIQENKVGFGHKLFWDREKMSHGSTLEEAEIKFLMKYGPTTL